MIDINPKKSLGQNFLKDKNIIKKIVSNVSKDDYVLEVGPGTGQITKEILKKTKNLAAVEVDKELSMFLEKKYSITVYKEDILKFKLEPFLEQFHTKKYVVIGSLPYYISKNIISKFLKTEPRPTDMTFIVQKEVADKYLYEGNLLHNTLKIYANEIKSLGLVQKTKFYPIPKVESKIIHIYNLKKITKDSSKFEAFLKKAYMFPRKTLKNNKNIESFEYSSKRPEELSYTDWQSLFFKNKNYINSSLIKSKTVHI